MLRQDALLDRPVRLYIGAIEKRCQSCRGNGGKCCRAPEGWLGEPWGFAGDDPVTIAEGKRRSYSVFTTA